MVGVYIAENDIGVGQRGLGAAAVVAHRTRSSARTLRPDLQCAAGINPDKGPASGTDFRKVDGRARTHNQSAHQTDCHHPRAHPRRVVNPASRTLVFLLYQKGWDLKGLRLRARRCRKPAGR